jgi:DNA-directed RNA polymerase subunit K/omega
LRPDARVRVSVNDQASPEQQPARVAQTPRPRIRPPDAVKVCVPPAAAASTRALSTFENVRTVGKRAMDLEARLDTPRVPIHDREGPVDALWIAKRELAARKCPMVVRVADGQFVDVNTMVTPAVVAFLDLDYMKLAP